MRTELNSPGEMLRRFLFAIVLLTSIAAIWLLASQLVGLHWGRLLAMLICAGGSVSLYLFGRKYFSFATIGDTLVFLNIPPRLHPELHAVYLRAEKIIELMRDVKIEVWERQKLRNELTEIVQMAPKVFELLREDILSVHPAIRQPQL